MTDTIIIKGEYHAVTQCGTCGVWYTVPQIVYECHRREGGYHCCPNGHSRGWDKGADAIEREVVAGYEAALRNNLAKPIGPGFDQQAPDEETK